MAREGFSLRAWGAVLALTEPVLPQLAEQHNDEAGGGDGDEHQHDDGQPLHVA